MKCHKRKASPTDVSQHNMRDIATVQNTTSRHQLVMAAEDSATTFWSHPSQCSHDRRKHWCDQKGSHGKQGSQGGKERRRYGRWMGRQRWGSKEKSATASEREHASEAGGVCPNCRGQQGLRNISMRGQ